MAEWYKLWAIPAIATTLPVPGASQWVDLGWLYLDPMQLFAIKDALGCGPVGFGTGFVQYALIDQSGRTVWSRDCRPHEQQHPGVSGW